MQTALEAELPREDMPFLAHLEELRWRIIRAVIAIVVFASVALVAKKVEVNLERASLESAG